MVSTSMCFLTRMRCATWSRQHLRTDNLCQYVQLLVQTKSVLTACLKACARSIRTHGYAAADGCLDVRQSTCSSLGKESTLGAEQPRPFSARVDWRVQEA